jgi:hypothetical protein
MEPDMKKAIMIAAIVILTVILIKHITNASSGSSSTTTKTASKTVFVDNDPHRYYYGYGTPAVNHYNGYKAQYYN